MVLNSNEQERAATRRRLRALNAAAQSTPELRALLESVVRSALSRLPEVVVLIASEDGGPIIDAIKRALAESEDGTLARRLVDVLPTYAPALFEIARQALELAIMEEKNWYERLPLRRQLATWLSASGFTDDAAQTLAEEAEGPARDVETTPRAPWKPGGAARLREMMRERYGHAQLIDETGSEQRDALRAIARLAAARSDLGDHESALRLARDAASRAEKLAAFRSAVNLHVRAFALGTLGLCKLRSGDEVGGEAWTREALALLEESRRAEEERDWLRDDSADAEVARLQNQLGLALLQLDRPREALTEFTAAEGGYQRHADQDPGQFSMELARVELNLARAARALDDRVGARARYGQAELVLAQCPPTPVVNTLIETARAEQANLHADGDEWRSKWIEFETLMDAEAARLVAGSDAGSWEVLRQMICSYLVANPSGARGGLGTERVCEILSAVHAQFRRSREVESAFPAPDWGAHQCVARTLNASAERLEAGDFWVSIKCAERALAICEALVGPGTLKLRTGALRLISLAESGRGRAEAAVEAATKALSLQRAYAEANPNALGSADYRAHLALYLELTAAAYEAVGDVRAATMALDEAATNFASIDERERAEACRGRSQRLAG